MEIKLCESGCRQEAKFQIKSGKWCCGKSHNSCPANRKKNADKVKQLYDSGKLSAKLRYQNLSDESKEKMLWNKGKVVIPQDELFVINSNWSSTLLKKAIEYYELKPIECECCKLTEWIGKTIVLELDHVNGDRTNNTLENLRLLCPNCHSQTDTFRGRNINGGIKKVSDEDLYNALRSEKSIRKALESVGLAPKGGNYDRAKKILNGG